MKTLPIIFALVVIFNGCRADIRTTLDNQTSRVIAIKDIFDDRIIYIQPRGVIELNYSLPEFDILIDNKLYQMRLYHFPSRFYPCTFRCCLFFQKKVQHQYIFSIVDSQLKIDISEQMRVVNPSFTPIYLNSVGGCVNSNETNLPKSVADRID